MKKTDGWARHTSSLHNPDGLPHSGPTTQTVQGQRLSRTSWRSQIRPILQAVFAAMALAGAARMWYPHILIVLGIGVCASAAAHLIASHWVHQWNNMLKTPAGIAEAAGVVSFLSFIAVPLFLHGYLDKMSAIASLVVGIIAIILIRLKTR